MKEFKFACPVCGQHITAAAGTSGTQIECPTCFQRIIVPQARSDETKLILNAAKADRPRPPQTVAQQGARTALCFDGPVLPCPSFWHQQAIGNALGPPWKTAPTPFISGWIASTPACERTTSPNPIFPASWSSSTRAG